MKGVKRKMKSEKGKVGKPLFFVGSIVVFLLIIALLNLWMFSSKDGISIDSSLFYTYRMVRICSIVFLLLSIVGYYYYGVIKSQYSEGKKNLALILVSLSVVILLCEIPFSFYAESDGVGLTWAHILWERKYWTPIQINVGDGTILSLRDDGKKADVTKKKILMIGDSFTAGDGLDSASFSYPSLVREKIEEAYPNVFSLVNLGEK
jgi:hypothetical protein